jgi:hypothetical protein
LSPYGWKKAILNVLINGYKVFSRGLFFSYLFCIFFCFLISFSTFSSFVSTVNSFLFN